MERNEPLLTSACYFWSNYINAFIFGHGPMTISLADIHMLTSLQITRSLQPSELLGTGSKRLPKISEYSGWASYIKKNQGTKSTIEDKEYIAFMLMWLERFIFCGSSCGPVYNHKFLAECLVVGDVIPLGKYLLGAAYHLLNQVTSYLLKNEAVPCYSGPWWLIQMWLNLYLHKTVKPDLTNLSFPSTNFAVGDNEITRGCLNYGEAASAISINLDRGHLFKKFIEALKQISSSGYLMMMKIMIWLCLSASNLKQAVLICALPVEFRHGHGKTSSSSHPDNWSTYEFYNPNFVARQFGLGQLSPRLYFSNILKLREGISEPLEALRVFQLGSELPSYHLADWARVTFTYESFDSTNIACFCNSLIIFCILL